MTYSFEKKVLKIKFHDLLSTSGKAVFSPSYNSWVITKSTKFENSKILFSFRPSCGSYFQYSMCFATNPKYPRQSCYEKVIFLK